MGIILKNITFKEDRALIKVQVEGCLGPEERAQLKQLLYNRYPNIKNHSCKNSKGPTFGYCIETTSIAHILEHVILEELAFVETRKCVFVAKTSNLGGGVAKIELKYYDDISTLQAIKRATSSLNELLSFAKCERFE